jgi:hypothetical protein
MSKKYDAGVKEYRDTYWTPEYVPLDTDLLACFKCTGQEGVPREEVAAAVALCWMRVPLALLNDGRALSTDPLRLPLALLSAGLSIRYPNSK